MNMIKVAYLKGFITGMAKQAQTPVDGAPELPALKHHIMQVEPRPTSPEEYMDFTKNVGKGEPAWVHSDVVNPMAEQAAYQNSRLLPRLGWSALGGAGLVGAGWLATEMYRRKKRQEAEAAAQAGADDSELASMRQMPQDPRLQRLRSRMIAGARA